MNAKFFSRIANPEEPELQNLSKIARSSVEEKLSDWGLTEIPEHTIRNLSFTYYHDWEHDDPDNMLLIQDPGPLYDRHRGEVQAFRDLGPDPEPTDLVSLHRRFAISWLVQRNADFAEQFVDVCAQHGIATPRSDWDEYIAGGDFFDDFYLADVVKYRTDSHTHQQRLASYREFLREELQSIDPDVLFVFGGDAWSLVLSEMNPTLRERIDVDRSKVTDVHGFPFQVNFPIKTTVVPLVHFSGRVFHSLLRNSYFDYLDEGLSSL